MVRKVRAFASPVLTVVSIAISVIAAAGVFFIPSVLTNNPFLSEFVAIGVLFVMTLFIAISLPAPRLAFGNLPFWLVFAALSPAVSVMAYLFGFWTLDEAVYMSGWTPALVVWLQFVAMVNLYLAVLIDRRASRRQLPGEADEKM